MTGVRVTDGAAQMPVATRSNARDGPNVPVVFEKRRRTHSGRRGQTFVAAAGGINGPISLVKPRPSSWNRLQERNVIGAKRSAILGCALPNLQGS
jgi:hypothetical protein